MTAEQCVLFLQALGAKQIKAKSNGWVEATCPLAPWTHTSGVDHHPSFGLTIKPGERSYFSCFACRSGSAEELIQALELYTKDHPQGMDFQTCRKILSDELFVIPLPEYSEHPILDTQFVEWPAYWLESFQKTAWADSAASYLSERKVEPSTQDHFDLRYDSKREMIVAPYHDVFGRFAGARGRSIHPDASGAGKHFDYSFNGRNNARFVWYNELVLNDPGPVVVVEGQFDCWRVALVYQKVVAALTAKPSLEKMKKLADAGIIIHIPDTDAAGAESIEVYRKFCNQLQMEYRLVKLGEGVKDPDDCHPDYLKDCIKSKL